MTLSMQDFEDRVESCGWAMRFADASLSHIHGAKVLDVGSGYGAMAIACERAGAVEYLGVDPWPFGASVARLDGTEYGARLCYEKSMPAERRSAFMFFEGFIEKLRGWSDHFDVALLFDVLEHIPDANAIVGKIYEMLRPEGITIAITSPLYLSSQGHHLWGTAWGAPWAHLKRGYEPSSKDVSPYRLQNYRELGKCTHPDIKKMFEVNGFVLAKETIVKEEIAFFNQHRQDIKPELFDEYGISRFLETSSRLVYRKPLALR